MKTDVLVIGSGVAGLSFAIKIADAEPHLKVVVLSKLDSTISNTAQAQGGIAVVLDKVRDSFEQHVADTMKAGKYFSDKKVVEMVVSQAPERLLELIDWGTSFDAKDTGELELGLEGGHSQKRIVHHRDLTGLELQRKLIKKAKSYKNIQFFDHYFVVDLLLNEVEDQKTCAGISTLDKQKNQQINISSKITFLASGGSGMVFQNSTNPAVATGDGVAMAYRAGARVKDMNFIQFHPTALWEEDKHPLFLVSEAVRGYGTYVVNHNGKRFLFETDSRGELATRDIVSEAIVKELKSSGEKSAFLDCRHLNFKDFQKKFPTIVAYCHSIGIDVKTDLIPIVPAAHYQCGGIEVDQQAKTSIKNLYASGECAFTGLHGANRLASNSLLEAIVFSHQASLSVLNEIKSLQDPVVPEKKENLDRLQGTLNELPSDLRQKLNGIMTYDLVHASKNEGKIEALKKVCSLKEDIDRYCSSSRTVAFYELRNMVQTAILVLEQAIDFSNRKNTIRKGHF